MWMWEIIHTLSSDISSSSSCILGVNWTLSLTKLRLSQWLVGRHVVQCRTITDHHAKETWHQDQVHIRAEGVRHHVCYWMSLNRNCLPEIQGKVRVWTPMGHHGNMGGGILSMALQTCYELPTTGIIPTYVQVSLPNMWGLILRWNPINAVSVISFIIQKGVRK